MDLNHESLPPRWRALVADREEGDPRALNRRHLEVAVILELAEAIKTGAIHVVGSLSYDDFWFRRRGEYPPTVKVDPRSPIRDLPPGTRAAADQAA